MNQTHKPSQLKPTLQHVSFWLVLGEMFGVRAALSHCAMTRVSAVPLVGGGCVKMARSFACRGMLGMSAWVTCLEELFGGVVSASFASFRLAPDIRSKPLGLLEPTA